MKESYNIFTTIVCFCFSSVAVGATSIVFDMAFAIGIFIKQEKMTNVFVGAIMFNHTKSARSK